MKKILLPLLAFFGCNMPAKVNTPTAPAPPVSNNPNPPTLDFSGPPTFVYKTKQDYYKNVPIVLSDDKTMIVSYPDPKDVYYNGKLAYPKRLENGFLLDNRGISPNVAFLSITYDEYSKLSKAPSIKDLQNMIIDKDPLITLCNCGNRHQFKNEVSELNELVKENLAKCQKIK